MKDKQAEKISRRGFLLAAGVGSAGAVAAVAAGVAQQPAAAAKTLASEEKTAGYAETRHISNYYRTARV